jgi:hypothetical protein
MAFGVFPFLFRSWSSASAAGLSFQTNFDDLDFLVGLEILADLDFVFWLVLRGGFPGISGGF